MGSKPRKYLPRSVKIRHRSWPIHYVEPEHDALASSDPEAHNLGCCNCHTREIYIDRTQEPAMLQNTLYHELAHAFWLSAGLIDDYDHEERIVCWTTEFLIELEAAGLITLKVRG